MNGDKQSETKTTGTLRATELDKRRARKIFAAIVKRYSFVDINYKAGCTRFYLFNVQLKVARAND